MRDIQNMKSIKQMSVYELERLADELRSEIIDTVSRQGGHLASNLGIVELTLALHYVYDLPNDKIIYDVGHQAYAHKLLTGRLNGFRKLRSSGGVSGFPSVDESEYDTCFAGHASTSVSAALGMARARDILKADNEIVAVIGDGALTGGMSYEALNDAGQCNTRLTVILNDNAMSIAPNVGALSRHLTQLRQSAGYHSLKKGIRRTLKRVPLIGEHLYRGLEKLRNVFRDLLVDGKYFTAMGFEYIGPVDGHDIKGLIKVLRKAKNATKPVLVHVITQKGKGYAPAESKPEAFHGIVPFFVDTGDVKKQDKEPSCGDVVCSTLSEIADKDIRVCGITAAMPSGTGMRVFSEAHPERYFDVGIAEEHAVTMAAGMAASGMRPYVAIYSTFLQRAYDQIMIDICRNNLPVTFLLDRSGLVGADGATHQGVYDLSYLSSMPNMIIAVPRDIRDLKSMIRMSVSVDAPMAIRYPKSLDDLGPSIQLHSEMEIGKWELISGGTDAMIFACGRMVQNAMQASIDLLADGISVGVTDARFVKPIDTAMLDTVCKNVKMIVTIEENTVCGGFGAAVLKYLAEKDIAVHAVTLGVGDTFVQHGSVSEQLALCGLDRKGIADRIRIEYRNRMK